MGNIIKDKKTGKILFESKKEYETIKNTLYQALSMETEIYGADLESADLKHADLSKADLGGLFLKSADLRRANLQESYLVNSILEKANLEGSDLKNADLKGANLEKAFIVNSNLEESNLEGANLAGATIINCSLKNAWLKNANFGSTILRGTNFKGSYCYGINLKGSNIKGANLSPIKKDFFHILKEAKNEIKNIEYMIKNNDLHYENGCASFFGTIKKINNEKIQNMAEYYMQYSEIHDKRPIDCFFSAMDEKDTPEKSIFLEFALHWINKFRKKYL